MSFQAAPEGALHGLTNGYASEMGAFSFYFLCFWFERKGSMLLGKFMWQDCFPENYH